MGLCATASLVTCFAGRDAWAAVPDVWADGQAPPDEGSWLRRDLFEASVGQSFTVRTPRFGRIALRLMRVEDCLSAHNAHTVNHPDCFTVVFLGSRSRPLEQATYRVESATLGAFLLFLVPGSTRGSSITYTATFNRVGTS